MNNNANYHFFLGGKDLEMEAIKELLKQNGVEYTDFQLNWDTANTSSYEKEINDVISEGKIPVFVELTHNSKLPETFVDIDHHNKNAHKEASILQVCDLLGIERTRDIMLIAANDAGYIPAMIRYGATDEEIARVRRRDRICQGITEAEEKEAIRALKENTEVVDGLTIVKMSHARTATIADRLFDINKQQNVLIFSDNGEVNYYGDGKLCQLLQGNIIGEKPAPWDPSKTIYIYDNFGGWTGGEGLGDENGNAYWGGYPDHEQVTKFILDYCGKKQANANLLSSTKNNERK